MNVHEPSLKPLVLDLLELIERTLSLAEDPETATYHLGAIAQADDHVRAALDLLPQGQSTDDRREEQLESLPPALPSEPAPAQEEAQYVSEAPPPSNDWLLGDDDGFGLG